MLRNFIFVLFIFFTVVNVSFAHSEAVKKEIYDKVTEGYFRGIEMTISKMPSTPEARASFMQKFRQNFDKQDFINKTYPCFQKYTEHQISTDHKVIQGCVSEYLVDYSQQQQHLFFELVIPQQIFGELNPQPNNDSIYD